MSNEEFKPELEHVFERSISASGKAIWLLIAGVGGVLGAIIGFVVALMFRVDQLMLHSITTLPILLGIGALAASRAKSKAPKEVGVGPRGVRVETDSGSQLLEWTQIGWATVAPTAMNQGKQLILFDSDGKTLRTLGDAFDKFESLCNQVVDRVKANSGEGPNRVQFLKARKNAKLAIGLGCAMLFAGGALGWMSYRDQRAARLLNEVGVEGDAKILRRFLAPNGVTTRVEYEVTSPDGRSGTRNAEVTPRFYSELERQQATSLRVKFVPSEPAISKLTEGEAKDDHDFFNTPAGGYVMLGLASLMGLFLFVLGGLLWHGWDIDVDSKTGKVSIKRYGEGR